MEKPDNENMSSEGQSYTFKNVLDIGVNPFSESDTLKFIRISPELLSRYATSRNIGLSENDAKTGILLIGGESKDHADILAEALGVSANEAIDIKVSDAGLLTKLNSEKVIIFSSSGSLISEDGRPLTRLDDQKINELHVDTADVLKRMFDSPEAVTKYDFIPLPPQNKN